jgi:spore germination protein YaaH
MTEHRRTTVRRRVVAGIAALGAAAMVGVLVPVPSEAATAPTPRRIVTGWGYFNTTSASALSAIQENADLLSDVSPFWYSATWDGSTSAITPASYAANRDSVLPLIKATGVAVLPTITDGMAAHRMATVLAGTTTRTALANQIVATVLGEGYDGIDLDFEGFAFNDGSSSWAATRPNWVAFIKALSAGLHAKGKLLSVTTPPMYTPTTGYWVYDWAGIGAYVDRLRVMTYDYSVSKAGPISPYSWVEKVAAFAVTQLAAGKVQMGVPNYGRDWVTGVTYSGVTGLCPTSPPDGANPSQVTTFTDALAFASDRHTFTSSGAASYLARFSGPSFTAPGIALVTAPVAVWNTTYKERSFTTKVAFTGTRAQKVVTTGTAAAASTAVTVASTAGLVAGLSVAGTSIPAGAKVASFDPTAKVVTLTVPTTAAIAGASLTFSGPAPASCTISRLGYYDDSTAAAARATLVGTYRLRGIAQWTLGGEDSAQWTPLRTYATSIAPSSTVVKISPLPITTYGGKVTVSALATSDGVPVSASATLFFRKAGTTTWTNIASSVTAADGRVTFPVVVNASGSYLVQVSGSFERNRGSGQAALSMRTAVQLTVPTAPVKPATRVLVTARMKPIKVGQVATLQVLSAGRYVSIASTKADVWGRAFFAVRSPARGVTLKYRVVGAGYTYVGLNYAYFGVTSA